MELLLWSIGLSGIYIYRGLSSNVGKTVAHIMENLKFCIEYSIVSVMLIIGIGLFLDYILKYENIL